MSHNAYWSSRILDSGIAVDEMTADPQPAPIRLEVNMRNPQSLDITLSRAVNQLIPAALERRHGILVTQLGSAKYSVEVDAEVPCGNIYEKRI